MPRNNGLAQFQKRLRSIPKRLKAQVQPALVASAEKMAGDMRRLVPVDSGALRDSITVTPAGQTPPSYSQGARIEPVPENAVAVSAGNTDARHAHFVEFGTTETPAQPFFLPAYRLNRKKASARIKRAMSKAVKEAK